MGSYTIRLYDDGLLQISLPFFPPWHATSRIKVAVNIRVLTKGAMSPLATGADATGADTK